MTTQPPIPVIFDCEDDAYEALMAIRDNSTRKAMIQVVLDDTYTIFWLDTNAPITGVELFEILRGKEGE